MTEYPDPSATAAATRNGVAVARGWIAEAWRIFRSDLWLWVGVAAFYFLAAILLKRIPFMGNLVLVLLTPIPLASALLLAREKAGSPAAVPPAVPAGWQERVRFFLQRPLAVFGRALRVDGFGFPLTLVCIVVLGLTMIAIIVEIMLAGGSAMTGLTGARYSGGPLRATTLLGISVALSLYALLAMALFHMIPLIMFRRQLVVPAIIESLRTWRRAPLSLALFGLLFLVPYMLIAAAFVSSATHWLGYLLVFSVGVVVLPVFVIGNYLSYCTLHDKPPTPGARS
jgi:hypothetical protein